MLPFFRFRVKYIWTKVPPMLMIRLVSVPQKMTNNGFLAYELKFVSQMLLLIAKVEKEDLFVFSL